MTARVAVVGASGYSGGELALLLTAHRGVKIAGLYSGPGGTASTLASIHPRLAGRAGPGVLPFDLASALDRRPDVVFLASPNEVSASLAKTFLDAGVRVIDLSGAFRLRDAADYPRWYGFTHPAPELLEEAVYGLTEWCDGALAGARLVANPGCYPTAVLLAAKPLLSLLAPGGAIVVDAASGVSGAGKKAELAYSYAELAGNFKAYGIGTHRHEPEMRRALGLPDGAPFVFVPHLLPAVRGILATLHLGFARPAADAEIAAAYDAAYAGSPFVRVRPAGKLPELKDVVGTPRAEIGWTLLDGGRRAVVVSAIDNLLKGAASQAVQNFNRMSGFPETEGLQ